MSQIVFKAKEFLINFLPFSYLSDDELTKLLSSVRIINVIKDKMLFQINDPIHDCFYIVWQGNIHLSINTEGNENIVSKCKEGDLFGLHSLFAKSNYLMNAKAREESIIFAIPLDFFKQIMISNDKLLQFVLERLATSNYGLDVANGNVHNDSQYYLNTKPETQYFQSLKYSKTPLTTDLTTTVKNAAQMITNNKVNAIVVVENNNPVGIVTDSDLRSKIATDKFPLSAKIHKIMSSPVITVAQSVSLTEVQLLLLQYGVSHLCVTEDGTDKTNLKGIITEHDIIVAQASNPGVLLKEIKASNTSINLKKIRIKLSELIISSLHKNIPLFHIMNIAGEINTAILKRAIEIATIEIGIAPTRFAWFSIGSQGRKEQLLYTDQDSFLIFEDVAQNKYRDVKDYFIKLSKKTTLILEDVGYKSSIFGNVASNINLCKSLTEWSQQFEIWINNPSEKNNKYCDIFFDYELVIGDSNIEDVISNLITINTKKNALFFDYLGNETLKKPTSFGFFKKLNVEEDGFNKDKFDIKNKGILHLVDGARLFALSNQIKGVNNTYQRLKQLAVNIPENAEVFLNCAEAFLVLSKIRTLDGFKNENDGQFIDFENLSKIDKEKLKNALLPMKELEELIKDTFQLTQFS